MKKILGLIMGMFGMISVVTVACTGITIKTEDNNIVVARTIEAGEYYLNSKIVVSPRGQKFRSLTPEHKVEGLKWEAKYGYVGAALITDLFVGEGINEKGLNAGLFYFPHYGSLENYDKTKKDKTLVDMQLVSWILSNCATVDEVKKAVKKLRIVNIGYDDKGTPLPTAHWRVSDANGNQIVIEIVEHGKVKIYENKIGVLTNSPDFDWHVKNLNNYINLYAGNAPTQEINGSEIFSFGAGTGSLGLPGDITPPSRFVRAFYYLSTMKQALNNMEGISSAFHILNNFDIPIGVEYTKEYKNHIPKDMISATQWTSACSLKEKEFYYKSMFDEEIKKIDLKKIDFANIKYQVEDMDKEKELKIKEIEIN